MIKQEPLPCGDRGWILNTASVFGLVGSGMIETTFISSIQGQAQAEVKASIEKQHPFRGLGKPEDIAKAAVFLTSEENSWITGIGLPVDGGFTSM
ncbi:classical c SDR [Ilyonectria robusta]